MKLKLRKIVSYFKKWGDLYFEIFNVFVNSIMKWIHKCFLLRLMSIEFAENWYTLSQFVWWYK